MLDGWDMWPPFIDETNITKVTTTTPTQQANPGPGFFLFDLFGFLKHDNLALTYLFRQYAATRENRSSGVLTQVRHKLARAEEG